MKRVLAMTLALILAVALVACGTDDAGETANMPVETPTATASAKPAETSQPHAHKHNSTVTTKATCVKDGVETFTCSCGDTYTEVIKATGEHSYEAKVTKETCAKDGVKTFTCSMCGDAYTETIPATGKHNYESKVTTKETCVTAGLKKFTCSMCGDAYTEDIPATGKHNYEAKVTTQETCAKDGVKTFTCSMCKDSYTQAIPATGKHNYEGKVTAQATCAANGVKTFACSGCNDSYTETIPGGHKWVNATCTAAKACSVCGAKDGSALGHTTKSGTCSRCGEDIFEPIVYSGKGDKVINNFTLPRGAYFVEYTHNGRSNFIVELYHGATGSDWDLVANDVRNCSGRRVIGDALDGDIRNGMLEVDADGDWRISIKKVSNTTTSTNLKGSGDWVTSGSFVATQKRYVCTYSGTNKNNFVVEVYSFDGDWNLAANDIAPCSGSKIITLDIGTRYFICVESDGDWTVDLGVGDSLETISPSDISDVGASGSGSSSGSDSSGAIVYYDDYYGVPDLGAIFGVKVAPNMTSGNGTYVYRSSDVYAAAGQNALNRYINMLRDCGFTGNGGIDGDDVDMAFYKNKELGLSLQLSVTRISSGEYVGILISEID